jgi:uncharacterized protein YkvS
MFNAFVNIFFVLLLEVGHGVVSDLAEEGVLMDRTLVENFSDKRCINSCKGSILRVE